MTADLPTLPQGSVPQHVAIIMDGNGRWARQRFQPRALGHRAGVRAARRIVRACHTHGVKVLTLFAFSQENWQRPALEVQLLMQLFARVLSREIHSLHRNGVRIRFIGEHGDFAPALREKMAQAEALTATNTGLTLVVAAGYGGHGDIVRAAQQLCREGLPITTESIESRLSMADLPHPDLMIRTGGESRISNFLMWQLAYAELRFVDTLWPDFNEPQLVEALAWYAGRERRFGRVPEGA